MTKKSIITLKSGVKIVDKEITDYKLELGTFFWYFDKTLCGHVNVEDVKSIAISLENGKNVITINYN